MRGLIGLLALAGALFVGGCSGSDDDPKESEDPGTDATWTSGTYVMTAHAVDDGCLDGGANNVAIPNNDSREFTNPLSFPGSADESFTTKLALVAPFSEVDVTFQKTGENAWEWTTPAKNAGVDIGALSDAWKGCTADFELGANWAAKSVGGQIRFEGKASFTITGATGDGCPVMTTPPCAVTLDMIATRQ